MCLLSIQETRGGRREGRTERKRKRRKKITLQQTRPGFFSGHRSIGGLIWAKLLSKHLLVQDGTAHISLTNHRQARSMREHCAQPQIQGSDISGPKTQSNKVQGHEKKNPDPSQTEASNQIRAHISILTAIERALAALQGHKLFNDF